MRVKRRNEDGLELETGFWDRPYYSAMWWVLFVFGTGGLVAGVPAAFFWLNRPPSKLALGALLAAGAAYVGAQRTHTRVVVFSRSDGVLRLVRHGWFDRWVTAEYPLDRIEDVEVQKCVRHKSKPPTPWEEDGDSWSEPHFRLLARLEDDEEVELTIPSMYSEERDEAARERIQSFLEGTG